MSLRLLVKQLVKMISPESTSDGNEVKAIMINADQALAVDRSPEEVRDSLKTVTQNRCLSVRHENEWTFIKASDNFFVIDHERFAMAFGNRVNFLNFTYSELTSLHPLFQVLGLDHRYLSRHVETETMISEGASYLSPDLTSHFRQRAYALSWYVTVLSGVHLADYYSCAIFHQSSKYFHKSSKLHELLGFTEIMLSDDMWINLIIETAEDEIETKSDRALVKIEQTRSSIKIYVPSDETGLYFFLRTELSLELSSLLGITHASAAKQIYRILNDETSTLDAIMNDEDISQVTWLEKPADIQRDWRSQDSMTPSSPEQTQESASSVTDRFENSSSSVSSPSSSPPAYPDEEISPDQLARDGAQDYELYSGDIVQQVVQKNACRQILQNVIKQVRQLCLNDHRFDSRTSDSDAFFMSNLAAILEDLAPTALRRRFGLSGDQSVTFAETSKLGAAEKLYVSASTFWLRSSSSSQKSPQLTHHLPQVFERLLALSMPGFTRKKWQSTIRSLVSILPE